MEIKAEIFNKKLKENGIINSEIPMKIVKSVIEAMEEYAIHKTTKKIVYDTFVFRRIEPSNNSIYEEYEIGAHTKPRTFPDCWCDMKICQGFYGEIEMCVKFVALLNKHYKWIK